MRTEVTMTERILFDIDQQGFKLREAKENMAVSEIISVLEKHEITTNTAQYVFEKAKKEIGRFSVKSYTPEEVRDLKNELDTELNKMNILHSALQKNENVNQAV